MTNSQTDSPTTIGSSQQSTGATSTTEVKATMLPRKRKEGREYIDGNKKRRAAYWTHFWQYLEAGKPRAECIYCENKTFACDSTLNGSKNVKTHWDRCPANPANDTKNRSKQSELVFDSNLESSQGEGRLRAHTFDASEIRKAMVKMIVVDELPFRFVENPGFKNLMTVACPKFKMPSRWTIARDSYQLYLDEKLKLRKQLEVSCHRVSVTTDTWTSIQRINYMCLTTHFIDKDWKLNKNIINFCPITSHKGKAIGKAVEDCLISWGLEEKLFTVTVDNAQSNNVACDHLKKMIQGKSAISGGKHLHVRCVAHIINLMVWDGLSTKETKMCLDRIRAAIKYVRGSPSRIQIFKDLVVKHKIECTLSLSMDVPTRWNSTYTMLDTAFKYSDIFWRMNIPNDPEDDGSLGNPTDDDWKIVGRLIIFLKEFKYLTESVSGSLYTTSNLAFFYIYRASELLNKWIDSSDADFHKLAIAMKEKYDKYFGELDKINLFLYLGVIVDPKVKLIGVGIVLRHIYGIVKGDDFGKKMKNDARAVFEEYQNIYNHLVPKGRQQTNLIDVSLPSSSTSDMLDFKKYIEDEVEMSGSDLGNSEFDRYLSDKLGEQERGLEVLNWWKLNEHKYPIMACIARDVLAIPVSTVASESAFSAGGRHLDKFRSSLTPKTVQSLICVQDWLRPSVKVDVEEKLAELEKLEKDLDAPDDIVCVE